MPTIRLSRPTPLTTDEIHALPAFATVSDAGTEERVRITLDLAELLPVVYALGATLAGFTVTLDAELMPVPAAPPALEAGADPWKLLDEGDARAEQAFRAIALDAAGRARVQTMLASPDATAIANACRIARWTGWKSGVQLVRKLVPHPNAAVRKEVVLALGELAGPSLTMAVRPLRTDPDADVRAAALVVLKQWGD